MHNYSQREMIDRLRTFFIDKFNREPLLIKSPGRINLIGEHTDYNDGFVLPAAIDNAIFFAIALNDSNTTRLISLDMNESHKFELNSDFEQSGKHWPDYIIGVVHELQKAGHTITGFDCVFGGNIPIGAGLSSSAALEGGITFGLNHLLGLGMTSNELALTGQAAENNFVGLNCGIMDQFTNINGKPKKVIKLDCRTLDYELFPFENEDLQIVLCNSNVSHNLATSEYNMRRQQCERGVAVIQEIYPGIKNLRDVDLNMLEVQKEKMEPVTYNRCKYVIEENERVNRACDHLQQHDFYSFGQQMYESHEGLSKLYEVSCMELDTLVDIASTLPGVYGARMMGGGFGGCTINLVEKDKIEAFSSEIRREYQNRTSKKTDIYITGIGGGTRVVS